MKKSQNILQQVNKNCYSLTLQPDDLNIVAPYSHGLCRFSGNNGAVESNVNLLAYYDRLFGNQFNNFLTPLNFRGVVNGILEENGLTLSGNKVFSNWLINKKVRVVKTTIEGIAMVGDTSAAQDASELVPFETVPMDIWQSNGVGAMSKEITLTLNIASPFLKFNADTYIWQTQKLESNEVYYFDNKTVLAIPCIASGVPIVLPFPPAITVYALQVAGRIAFACYYMVTLLFEVDENVKRFDHIEIDLKQALAENKIIIEQNPDIFNPVYKPLTQTEKENIIIIDNL